jgi:AraC-like DNA-binding protein
MVGTNHLSLREKVVPAGTEWMPAPEGWAFIQVVEGDGYLMKPKSPQHLRVGDFLVAKPGIAAALRASQIGNLRLQMFELCPHMMLGVLTPFERLHLEMAVRDNGHLPTLYPASSVVAKEAAALIARGAGADNLVLRVQMLHLAMPILRDHLPIKPEVDNGYLTARERFEKLLQEMSESQFHEHSLVELAQLCGCSIRHFSRLYKEFYGHSMVTKKTELRLQKAQQLLANTDNKIIDVAMESGFQHVGLFTSLFKRRFRATPSEYRRRSRRHAIR